MADINHYFKEGHTYDIKVKASAKKNSIELKDNLIHVKVSATPTQNKANKAIETLFKKELNIHIEIIKGHLSKHKTIQIFPRKS